MRELKLATAMAAVFLLVGATIISQLTVALTNADLIKTPASPNLLIPIVRFGVNAVGDVSPSWWWRQSGTCASNSIVSDIGSCNDAQDGNSFIAIVSNSGIDVRQFGVKFDNSTDNSTTLQAAFTWGARGNEITFPGGGTPAKFGTGITFNLPASVAGLTVTGAGSRLSILAYTGTGFAITGTYNTQQNTTRWSGFDLTTNGNGTASGILLKSNWPALTTANQPNNQLIDVGFYGADGGLASNYFATALKTQGVNAVNLINDFVAGGTFQGIGWDMQPATYTTTGASGNGTTATLTFGGTQVIPVGIIINVSGVTPAGYNTTGVAVSASSAGSVSYPNTTTGAQTGAGTITACCVVANTVTNGEYQSLATGFNLGNYAQTILFNQTNVAAASINVPANAVSVEEISINASDLVANIINTGASACVIALTVTNNFVALGSGNTGINMAQDCGGLISGNTFAPASAGPLGTAINLGGTNGAQIGMIITGNLFQGMVTGLQLATSETGVQTSQNKWISNTNNIVNNSTTGANTIGSPSIIPISSGAGTLAAATTFYCNSVLCSSSSETAAEFPFPANTSGVFFDDLNIFQPAGPGGSVTNTFTWRCNGVNSAVTTTLVGSGTFNRDVNHSVIYSTGGSLLCDMQAVIGAGASANTMTGSVRLGLNP